MYYVNGFCQKLLDKLQCYRNRGRGFAPAVQQEGNSGVLQWLLRAEFVNGEQHYSSSIKYLHSGFTQESRQRERQVEMAGYK